MTFDDTGRKGTGVLVPCRATLTTPEALIAEAQELWNAEQPSVKLGLVGARWGCVGVRFRAEPPPHAWADAWSNHFREHTTKAVAPVNDDGLLDIPWPEGAEQLDLILATATDPEPTPVTAIDVADAWIHQSKGHERYFFENIVYGIRTPDDHAIWERIEKVNPGWLRDNPYEDAIKLLDDESATDEV